MQRLQAAFVFLFGTPRRALYSTVALLLAVTICYPPALRWVFGRILDGVSPILFVLAKLAVVVGIGCLALRMMFGGVKLSKSGKKK